MGTSVFSATLQALRKERGVTQEQLAVYLGVSPQAVSKWENGSYPDGDLLPKIADYFSVSIDYLYGREKKHTTMEQRLFDSVREQSRKANPEKKKDWIEQLLDCIWSIHLAGYGYEKEYTERFCPKGEEVMASAILQKEGFSYMRLNQTLEGCMLFKEPEGGFSSYFKVTEELAELFAFLGDQDNLNILFYMLSLNDAELVQGELLAKKFQIAPQKAEKALAYLCRMNNGGMFFRKCVLREETGEEYVYGTNWIQSCAGIMLLAGADAMLNPPTGYMLESGCRQRGWLSRNTDEERKERKGETRA